MVATGYVLTFNVFFLLKFLVFNIRIFNVSAEGAVFSPASYRYQHITYFFLKSPIHQHQSSSIYQLAPEALIHYFRISEGNSKIMFHVEHLSSNL